MNPSFRNLFMKKFTRERVVPTISASVSCDTFGKRAVSRLGFTVTRQQQERAREPLLAGVEELVDEILFDPDIPRQHVGKEPIRERGVSLELPHHVLLLDDDDRARAMAVAVAIRYGCPTRQPSPKKCPRSSTAMTASFPACDNTESRTVPSSMYMTLRRRVTLSKDRRPGPVLDALSLGTGPIDDAGGFDRCCVLRLTHRSSPCEPGASLTGVYDRTPTYARSA